MKGNPPEQSIHFQDHLNHCFPLHLLPAAVLMLPSIFFYDPLFFLRCFAIFYILLPLSLPSTFLFCIFLSPPLLCCFLPAPLCSVLAEVKLARILIPESLSYREQAPLKFLFAVFTITQWYSVITIVPLYHLEVGGGNVESADVSLTLWGFSWR